MNTPRTTPKRPVLTVGIIFLLFFVPLLAAWILYDSGKTIGEGTTNHGQLIQPPRNLYDLNLMDTNGGPLQQPFHRHWLLLYISPTTCGQGCEKNLYYMRQIWKATNKNAYRVQRAILTFAGNPSDAKLNQLLAGDYRGTVHVIADKQQFTQVMAGLPSTDLALNGGYLYLVDPLGNIMMAYAPDVNPSGIFKDLEKLLKISQIG